MAEDWKSRAVPISDNDSSTNSWMSRAMPAQDNAESPSILESALRGGAQGATLGFEDELVGAVQAAREAGKNILTNPSEYGSIPQLLSHAGDIADVYRQKRDEERQANEAAEKTNPLSFTAGQITGGVGAAVAGGALGEAGALLSAPTVTTATLGGGLAGLGSSKADLTKGEINQAAKDTALGAGLGFGGGVAASGLKGVFSHLAEKSAGQDISKAFEYGKKGVGLGSKEEAKGLSEKFYDLVKNLSDRSETVGKDLGKQQRNILESATSSGLNLADQTRDALLEQKQNLQKILENSDLAPETASRAKEALGTVNNILNEKKVSPEQFEKIFNESGEILPPVEDLADKFQIPRENISPSELQLAKGEVKGKGVLGQTVSGKDPFPAVTSQYTGVSSGISDILNKGVPGLEDVNNKISNLKNIQELAGHVKDLFLKQDNNAGLQLANKFKALTGSDLRGSAARDLYTQMQQYADQVGDTELSSILKNIPESAEKYDLSQKIQKEGMGGFKGLFGSIKSKSLDWSNKAGQAASNPVVNAVGGATITGIPAVGVATPRLITEKINNRGSTDDTNIPKNPIQQKTDSMYLAPPDQLNSTADTLIKSNIPAGQALKAALQNNDNDAKNRAIFAIMQNPAARKLITPNQ